VDCFRGTLGKSRALVETVNCTRVKGNSDSNPASFMSSTPELQDEPQPSTNKLPA
jgi:hypothetical protein